MDVCTSLHIYGETRVQTCIARINDYSLRGASFHARVFNLDDISFVVAVGCVCSLENKREELKRTFLALNIVM